MGGERTAEAGGGRRVGGESLVGGGDVVGGMAEIASTVSSEEGGVFSDGEDDQGGVDGAKRVHSVGETAVVVQPVGQERAGAQRASSDERIKRLEEELRAREDAMASLQSQLAATQACPTRTGVPRLYETATPYDPTVGPYGGPREGAVYYERSTPVWLRFGLNSPPPRHAPLLQGYLDHRKQLPPYDHHRFLGIGLL